MRRLRRALEEFVIEGMKTTIPLHQKLIEDPEFQAGELYDQVAGGVAGARTGLSGAAGFKAGGSERPAG